MINERARAPAIFRAHGVPVVKPAVGVRALMSEVTIDLLLFSLILYFLKYV